MDRVEARRLFHEDAHATGGAQLASTESLFSARAREVREGEGFSQGRVAAEVCARGLTHRFMVRLLSRRRGWLGFVRLVVRGGGVGGLRHGRLLRSPRGLVAERRALFELTAPTWPSRLSAGEAVAGVRDGVF